jgi:hypothetical protein
MKGCQIGQSKLSIRKASEGIGKETEERAEGKAQAGKKEQPISRVTSKLRDKRDSSGSTAREIRTAESESIWQRDHP